MHWICYHLLFMIFFPLGGALIAGLVSEENGRGCNIMAGAGSLLIAAVEVLILIHYVNYGEWSILPRQVAPGLEIKLRVEHLPPFSAARPLSSGSSLSLTPQATWLMNTPDAVTWFVARSYSA